MKSMEVRRKVEQERGRDFADAEALLDMDGQQARPRLELRRARDTAPTMYAGVAVTSRVRDEESVRYFYDGLDDDEVRLAPHAGDVQREQVRGDVGFFSPKRIMGGAAVLLASGGGAFEVADYVHAPTDSKVLAAIFTTMGLGVARMWYMRRIRPRKLTETFDQISKKATDTENGAIMVSNRSVDIGELKPDYRDMATSSMYEQLGLDPAYMEAFVADSHFNYTHRGRINKSPSEVVEQLLAIDIDPDEFWITALRDRAIAMSELQAQQQNVEKLQEESEARAAFAGINANPDETKELKSSSVSLKTEVLTSLHEILLLGQDRYHQRQKTEAIDAFRQLLEESITSSDKELEHPLATELGVFKAVLFESLLELDLTNGNPVTKEDLARINTYLRQIPVHLRDVKHTEQVYSGMVKRLSDVVELPGWDEVQDRFLLAG